MFSISKFLPMPTREHRANTFVGISSALLGTIAGMGAGFPRTAQAQIIDLASFNVADGNGPGSIVTFDSAGNLYGTAGTGGLDNDGTVWEIPNVGGSYGTVTTVDSFTGKSASGNGNFPASNVIFDSGGNMYGTTNTGGSADFGVIWEIAKNSGGTYGSVTDLASFTGGGGNFPNGIYPTGNVVFDSAGNMYGTTTEGGSGGVGAIWELAKGATALTTVASFSGTNGTDPLDGVVFDSAGDMFGTTYEGGANGDGNVWEIVKGSTTITNLASFTGTGAGNNGAFPGDGAVIIDAAGNLYGTTTLGGTSTFGTVWEIPKTGSSYGTLETLADFNMATGTEPQGAAIDSAGDIFGTTGAGGSSGAGTVWELAAGSGTITDIAAFNYANGDEADNSVSIDSAGNLYGTTQSGGANGDGTVWEIKGVASEGGAGTASAPEPCALALLTPGLASGLVFVRRRSRASI